jgi:hypothetical protein
MERSGLRWLSALELAADADRWAVTMRDERDYRKQLRDLAIWRRGADRPVAIVADAGHRREDRQRMILEGWRDAIWAEQYVAVKYDRASAAAATKIRRIAKRAQLTPPGFIASVQRTAEETRSIGPDPDVDELARVPDEGGKPHQVDSEDRTTAPEPQLVPPPAPAPRIREAPPPPPEPEESTGDAAERYREIFGLPEPKQRRRWRR